MGVVVAQSVEIGITLLYQLGEGASEDAIKSGGSLGALASGSFHQFSHFFVLFFMFRYC